MRSAQLAQAKETAQRIAEWFRAPMVNGLLYPTHMFSPQIVPVPVHRGFFQEKRPCDLYTNLYVSEYNIDESQVVEVTVQSCTFPFDGPNPLGHRYHISKVKHEIRADSNFLIPLLAGDDTLLVRGDLLVVKCDRDGKAADILEDEVGDVTQSLISILQERRTDRANKEDSFQTLLVPDTTPNWTRLESIFGHPDSDMDMEPTLASTDSDDGSTNQ